MGDKRPKPKKYDTPVKVRVMTPAEMTWCGLCGVDYVDPLRPIIEITINKKQAIYTHWDCLQMKAMKAFMAHRMKVMFKNGAFSVYLRQQVKG